MFLAVIGLILIVVGAQMLLLRAAPVAHEGPWTPQTALRAILGGRGTGMLLVLGGDARLCYHGVDRVMAGTSTLLKDGGRINLTLRKVH